jgi:hypothetical protein
MAHIADYPKVWPRVVVVHVKIEWKVQNEAAHGKGVKMRDSLRNVADK